MFRPFLESRLAVNHAKGCEIVNSLVLFDSLCGKCNQLAPLGRGISLLLLACLFAFVNPDSLAAEIKWGNLNLTPQQETQMDDLESDWQKVHHDVSVQIERDTAELKTILPTGDSQKIRQLQNRIMNNRTYLMNESMDTFLRKREMLSPAQRSQLQQMLPCGNTNTSVGRPAQAAPPADR